MLSLILIASLAIAETSPRGKLEDFFRQVATILSVTSDSQQARDDVRNLLVGSLTDARLPGKR